MRLRAGTSGFSYAAWKGSFYPEELPAREMLACYARQLPAVEINNTFYRLPKASVLEGWAAQVPEDFRFALKASRRITHFKRLASVEEETQYLLEVARVLGARLGAILFQLPPNLPVDLARLETFLALLPDGTPAAFEFRHASWEDDGVSRLLRVRNFARVIAEDEERPEPTVDATASWGYLRLRRPEYSPADLAAWMQRLRTTSWEEVFVFFKHEDAGTGPRLAAELLALGAERREPVARKRTRRRRAG